MLPTALFIYVFTWAVVFGAFCATVTSLSACSARRRTLSWRSDLLLIAMSLLRTIEYVLRLWEVLWEAPPEDGADQHMDTAWERAVKHAFFVVPQALLFASFCILLYFWAKVVDGAMRMTVQEETFATGPGHSATPKTSPLSWLKRMLLLINAVAYAVLLLLTTVFFVCNDCHPEVVATSNLFVTLMLGFSLAGFIVYGRGIYAVALQLQRHNLQHWHRHFMRMTQITAIAALFLVAYSVLLTVDSVRIAAQGSSVVEDFDYSSAVGVLWLYRVCEIVPPVCLVVNTHSSAPRRYLARSKGRSTANEEKALLGSATVPPSPYARSQAVGVVVVQHDKGDGDDADSDWDGAQEVGTQQGQ